MRLKSVIAGSSWQMTIHHLIALRPQMKLTTEGTVEEIQLGTPDLFSYIHCTLKPSPFQLERLKRFIKYSIFSTSPYE